MNFPYFISNMLYENFCFVRKYIHFIFIYVVILFVCLSFYLSFFQKYLVLSVIICNPQLYHTYVRFKSSLLQENLHFLFQLYSNFICMCIIVSEFLKKIFNFISYPKLSSILSCIF